MNRLGIETMLLCSNVATARSGDEQLAAAQLRELGRSRRALRRAGRLRGARVGQVRRQLRDGRPHRAPRRSPAIGRVPRQLPHPVEGSQPGSDRDDPGRQDLLRPAGGRAPPLHGRALVEPSSPTFSRRGRLRPRCVHGSSGADGLRRPDLARDLQRHFSPVRPTRDSGRCAALPALAGDTRPPPGWARRRAGAPPGCPSRRCRSSSGPPTSATSSCAPRRSTTCGRCSTSSGFRAHGRTGRRASSCGRRAPRASSSVVRSRAGRSRPWRASASRSAIPTWRCGAPPSSSRREIHREESAGDEPLVGVRAPDGSEVFFGAAGGLGAELGARVRRAGRRGRCPASNAWTT